MKKEATTTIRRLEPRRKRAMVLKLEVLFLSAPKQERILMSLLPVSKSVERAEMCTWLVVQM
ncbi:hypothetical protein D3C87_1924800 [compost metagenome]